MKDRILGNTDLLISDIALGTDYYGKTIPEETALKLLDKYCELGGRIIDTAHVYSDYLPGEKHMSEKVIGRWREQRRGTYDPVIATKGGFPPIGDMHTSRIKRNELEKDIDESLQCLKTDCIDLYYLHRDDPAEDTHNIIDWMESFVEAGKIRYYACSNWKASRIDEASRYAVAKGYKGFVASQIKWSLAQVKEGSVDDDTLVAMTGDEYRWYEKSNIPVFAYSSQAKGFFSKVKEDGNGGYIIPAGKAGIRYGTDENMRIYGSLRKLSDESGVSVTALALAWLMKRDIQAVPIIGSNTVERLTESVSASDVLSMDIPIQQVYNL